MNQTLCFIYINIIFSSNQKKFNNKQNKLTIHFHRNLFYLNVIIKYCNVKI